MSKNSLHLFLSYAHEDRKFSEELSAHLSPLKHLGLITEWNDREIRPGTDWEDEILQSLDRSDLVVLLVSSDFINSGYCYGVEMTRALACHDRGTACVIPVIARPCRWSALPFAKLQALPAEAKAITTWADRDSAYLSVVQGVEDAARRLLASSSSIAAEWVASLLARRRVTRVVQLFLKERGLYHGPINGEPANVPLHEAVREFQLRSGLLADGLIGPETLRAIVAQSGPARPPTW